MIVEIQINNAVIKTSANSISYDNSKTKVSATNAQQMVDYIASKYE